MPYLKHPRKTQSVAKLWDQKTGKSGLRHTVFSVNGDQYTGEWLDNRKHGKGIQFWKMDDAIYDGHWIRGKRDGYGTYSRRLPGGPDYVTVYSGEWKNDRKHGNGKYFYSSSVFYDGEWRNDQRSGWGTMFYENGDVYEGEWLNDKPNGQGMLSQANDNRYEGGWRDGKKSGHGKFYFLDSGQLYEGFWQDGAAKYGSLTEFGRDEAPMPTKYTIPKIHLLDPDLVLKEAESVIHRQD